MRAIARLMMSAAEPCSSLPLSPGAAGRIGVTDLGNEAFAPEDRLDIAGATAIGLDPFHVGADRPEALEIGADVSAGLGLQHAELLKSNANAEIDHDFFG